MWDWAIWGSLILAGPIGIAALALFATRARQAWREATDTRRDVVRRLDDLTQKAAATAERAAAAGEGAELQRAIGRLRVSIARLEVLRTALARARVTFEPVTVFLTRK
jgi:hypothetical protein